MMRRPLVLVLLVTGCTYGPPHHSLGIGSAVFDSTGTVSAIAVRSTWERSPTGFSRYPDGGASRILSEAGAVYLCDTLTLAVRRIWRADRPANIRSGFVVWMGPWNHDGIYLSVRGYTTTTTEPKAFTRLDFRINPDSTVSLDVREPPRGAATGLPVACVDKVVATARTDPPAHLP